MEHISHLEVNFCVNKISRYHECFFSKSRYLIQILFMKASQKECTECGDKIFGTYYTIDDKVVCEQDYKVTLVRFSS